MAINKSKAVMGGQVTASYWKLMNVHMLMLGSSKKLSFDLGLFLDQTKASLVVPCLSFKHYEIDITQEQSLGDLRALAYTYIMANDEEFSEATQV